MSCSSRSRFSCVFSDRSQIKTEVGAHNRMIPQLVLTLGVFVLSVWTATAGQSSLADAAEKSDRATIRALLKQRTDVNAPQADGMTALHWAVYLDDFETARLLAEANANVK